VTPTLVVRIPLEGSPSVRIEASTEAEVLRLEDWIRAHVELAALVQAALAVREGRAA
jgi:hypothetical protein